MPIAKKESALAAQAKKIFPVPGPSLLILFDLIPGYPEEPRVVQSFTTYSLGETPIVNFSQP